MTQTQLVVQRDLGWVFRGQPEEDYGIDAQVEVVEGKNVLGLLLALQIKGGASWFGSRSSDGWWFYERSTLFRYWLGHTMPVVVVLADLDSGRCHWQVVSESSVAKGKGDRWKLSVPRGNVLDRSAVGPLRAVAEAGVRRAAERRPVGTPVSQFGPAELEVHTAFPGFGLQAEAPPEYLVRPHDHLLDEIVGDALGPQAKSGLAVLVGPSSSGKTRALYEVLHRPVAAGEVVSSLAEAGWRVWPTLNPLPPRRFLDELELVGPRTVVWMNEAQRYLRDPSVEVGAEIATRLRDLLTDDTRGPVLVLGTLWREFWDELTRKPDVEEVDRFVSARRLLEGGYVRVPDRFTNAEVSVARRSGDQRMVWAAGQDTGTGVTQILAGVPDLLRRWETGSGAQRAVIHAAMDARRFGHREELSETFLRAAAHCYLTGSDLHRADVDSSWFDTAIADLVRPDVASGPMLHQGFSGYRLDGLLDQEGRAVRRFEFPPDGFWSVAAESDMAAASRMRLAESAESRLRLQIAARLYEVTGTEAAGKALCDIALRCDRGNFPQAAERLMRCAVTAGYPAALMSLARQRFGRGDRHRPAVMNLLREAADLDDVEALDLLAHLLESGGDKAEAEAVARRAADLGSWEAMVSVAEWRDIEFPDEAEALIGSLPESMRPPAWACFAVSRDGVDDAAGAERLALSLLAQGDPKALLELAECRAEAGRKESARRLLEHIDRPSTVEEMLQLALVHVRAGNQTEARSLVAAAVAAATGQVSEPGSGIEDVEGQLTSFVSVRADVVTSLSEVLHALDERYLADRLYGAMERPRLGRFTPNPTREDEDEPHSAVDDEVGHAYATLAEFHARRGEFPEAESLAFRAAAVGTADGLEALSRELMQRGDRAEAERVALCAVNMGSSAALEEVRADGALLVLGLDAGGNTAAPWGG